MAMLKIDGEWYNVSETFDGSYLPMLETDAGDYYVAEDSDAAGDAAVKYWEDMKANDPGEFLCLIGEERLIKWGCGESDSFGISSWEEFLKVVHSVPHEEFGGYDGTETDVESISKDLREELGFTPTVAYRYN